MTPKLAVAAATASVDHDDDDKDSSNEAHPLILPMPGQVSDLINQQAVIVQEGKATFLEMTKAAELNFIRHIIIPATLLILCPPSLLLLIHLIVDLKGDVGVFVSELLTKGLTTTLWTEVWGPILGAVAVLFPYSLVACTTIFLARRNASLQSVITGFWILCTALLFSAFGDDIMPVLNVISKSKDSTTYKFLLGYSLFELLLLKVVPGNTIKGPVTPKNNRPNYKDNGMACFVVTLACFFAFSMPSSPFYFFPASIVFDNFKEMIAACNVLSLTLCLLLNIKGLVAPTNSDVINDKNLIMSYYWGRELHPEVWGVSIKQFTNCRFGMMGWPCIILSFAAAQYAQFGYVSDAMFVNVALQIIYIAKFFHWEAGYFATMDMQEDRAGFYICWGCISWLPCLYTSSTLALVNEGAMLGRFLAGSILIFGCLNVWFNYEADAQRKRVRECNAECQIWGRKAEVISAKYRTSDGVEHSSILLVSGFWGVSRHSHYLFELLAAFSWCVPGSILWLSRPGAAAVSPLAYFIFLTILLIDRSIRDDKRCGDKYGQYWAKYRAQVPYKILPLVF